MILLGQLCCSKWTFPSLLFLRSCFSFFFLYVIPSLGGELPSLLSLIYIRTNPNKLKLWKKNWNVHTVLFMLRSSVINPPSCAWLCQALTHDRAPICVLFSVPAPRRGLPPGSASSFRRIKRLEGGVQGSDEGPGRNHPFRHGSDCELKELLNWKDQRSVEIMPAPMS